MSVDAFIFASMSDVPLLVVYDYKNRPDMINKEYTPYTNKYQKGDYKSGKN